MSFEIDIPDQVIKEEPEMQRFLESLQLLVNRMVVSHYKYGAMSDKYPDSARAIDSVPKRLSMYAASGNTEDCLDAANFLIIEHLFPSHVKAHFRAQGSHESPGLVWHE
jgi:hypothetical protein